MATMATIVGWAMVAMVAMPKRTNGWTCSSQLMKCYITMLFAWNNFIEILFNVPTRQHKAILFGRQLRCGHCKSFLSCFSPPRQLLKFFAAFFVNTFYRQQPRQQQHHFCWVFVLFDAASDYFMSFLFFTQQKTQQQSHHQHHHSVSFSFGFTPTRRSLPAFQHPLSFKVCISHSRFVFIFSLISICKKELNTRFIKNLMRVV
jgi:hypothetical protein